MIQLNSNADGKRKPEGMHHASKAGKRMTFSRSLLTVAVTGSLVAPVQSADNLAYLKCLLDQTPPGGWVKASTTTFSSAWASPSQGGVPDTGYSSPSAVVTAWSSMGWDSKRSKLILWGGGHAIYYGNEVYLWQGNTSTWTRGSLPTRIEAYAGHYLTVDNITPQSSHTYDNNLYVPINDRFVTFGGAAFNTGNRFVNRDASGALTLAGPWMWNPASADPNKVGGADGSGYLAATSGGQMWSNQRGNWTGAGDVYSHVATHTAYRTENRKDVIYVTGDGHGSGFQPLFRYELGNIAAGQPGTFHLIGLSYYAPTYQGAAVMDTKNNLYIHTSASGSFQGLGVWNVSVLPNVNGIKTDCSEGSQQSDRCLIDQYVTLSEANGTVVPVNTSHGIGFDSSSGKIYLWDGRNQNTVWETQAEYLSNGSLSSRWTVIPRVSTTIAQPRGGFQTGVLGKWHYVAELRAFIALDEYDAGTRDAPVWLYKPFSARVTPGLVPPASCQPAPP